MDDDLWDIHLCVCVQLNLTTLLMVFNVMYTICKGLKLDVQMFQSVTSANYQHVSICQHK